MAASMNVESKEGEHLSESEEYTDEDDDDDDDDESSVYEAVGEFAAQEPGDLNLKVGDILSIITKRKDGWWIAENEEGETGLVPSTYLKLYSKSSREGADSPRNILKCDKDNLQEEINNENHSSPTLLRKYEDDAYSMAAFLYPKLSSSGLFFLDLEWDDTNKTLKPKIMKCQQIITLVECRYVPSVKTDMNILSCHIRMCLHDGNKILSNVHTVSAKWESKDPQKWSFISSISQTNSYLEDSKIFIRTNTAVATLGILFQLCIIYKEQKNTEKKELSCGWSFMRLLDDSGIPVHNKSKVLHIHEGNPFDKDINSLSLIEKNVLKTFISKSKQPQLILRLSSPDKDMKHQLDFLPNVLIGPCSLIFLIFLYRNSLADCLLQQADTIINNKLQHCPVESTFPKLFQQPDILNILRQEMLEQIRAEKKLTKNIDRLKKVFHRVYKETAYFLLNCNILPPFRFDDFSGQQTRRKEIEKLILIRQTKGPLGIATSQNISHKPFSINELAMDIVGQKCLSLV